MRKNVSAFPAKTHHDMCNNPILSNILIAPVHQQTLIPDHFQNENLPGSGNPIARVRKAMIMPVL